MFTVPSSSGDLGSDAGHCFNASAARPVHTPPTPSMSAEASSPQRGSAHGWLDYHDAIRRADIKDRQADSRNNRRVLGSRLKHKWSAVKLVNTPMDTSEERAQATLDKFRALSPASQEALLQSHEQQSDRSRDEVQCDQSLPRSPSIAPASAATSNFFDDSTRRGVERHLMWERVFDQFRDFQRDEAGLNVASKSKSTATAGIRAAAPSTVREETQFEDWCNDDSSAYVPALGSDSRSGFDNECAEETRTRSNCSTPACSTPTSGLNGRAETTLNGNSETEVLTASQLPRASDSILSEESLEQAMRTLGLGDFVSVEMSTLQECLNNALASCNVSESNEAANAFAAIVKHQAVTQCWDRCLRWNEARDSQLLDHEVDFICSDGRGAWDMTPKDVARYLGTTEADCRQRWEFLTSQKAVPLPCEVDTDESEVSRKANGWTAELDQLLMDLKSDDNAWCVIAKRLNMDERECKHRFKLIKPKNWKPKSKKKSKKEKAAGARKQQAQQKADIAKNAAEVESIAGEDEGFDTSPDPWSISPNHVWTSEQDGLLSAMVKEDCYRWSEIARALHRSVDDCKDRSEKLDSTQQVDSGWGINASVSACGSCGRALTTCMCDPWGTQGDNSPGGAGDITAADPNDGWLRADFGASSNAWPGPDSNEDYGPWPAPYTPPKVTFWATIESAGKSIQVSIASKDVSGPEKSITTGGMQAVWRWIYDMGLSDKVGLQDAFDLAESMHQSGVVEQVETKKARSDSGGWC